MNVQIDINRTLRGNDIIEIFTLSPKKNKFYKDDRRSLYYLFWLVSHEKGIGKFYKLKERKDQQDNIINIYEHNSLAPIPKMHENYNIKYLPVLGEKKCTKCIHYRKIKENKYCRFRGKKLKNDYWYKCDYWMEIWRTIN